MGAKWVLQGPPIFGSVKTIAFLTSKDCVNCFGTSAPSASHLTVSLFLCSSGSRQASMAAYKARLRVSAQKNPSMEGTEEKSVSLRL